jgi:hypothetical protein
MQQQPLSEYNNNEDNDKGFCEEMGRMALHSGAISMCVQAELTGITTKEQKDDLLGEWFEVLELVRAEWNRIKAGDESLCAGYRAMGQEDDKEHLDVVMHRLSCAWRMRDHMLGRIDDTFHMHFGDYRDMALFILLVVRAEELELEGLRMTRVVRSKYGDAGLPVLEGWLGGERSVAWWLRESTLGDVY